MKHKFFLLSISIILLNFAFKAEAQQQHKVTKTDQIAAPEQVAPIPSAKLNSFPRKTIFEWKHVEGASKYNIVVEYNDGTWHLQKSQARAFVPGAIWSCPTRKSGPPRRTANTGPLRSRH